MLTLAPAMAHAATGRLQRFKTFNLTLSNVPGSRETLYWNGLELDAIYPVSMPMHQNALNFTVFSYRDNIEMGIIGCRTSVPHLQRILEYLHEALDLLEQEVDH